MYPWKDSLWLMYCRSMCILTFCNFEFDNPVFFSVRPCTGMFVSFPHDGALSRLARFLSCGNNINQRLIVIVYELHHLAHPRVSHTPTWVSWTLGATVRQSLFLHVNVYPDLSVGWRQCLWVGIGGVEQGWAGFSNTHVKWTNLVLAGWCLLIHTEGYSCAHCKCSGLDVCLSWVLLLGSTPPTPHPHPSTTTTTGPSPPLSRTVVKMLFLPLTVRLSLSHTVLSPGIHILPHHYLSLSLCLSSLYPLTSSLTTDSDQLWHYASWSFTLHGLCPSGSELWPKGFSDTFFNALFHVRS